MKERNKQIEKPNFLTLSLSSLSLPLSICQPRLTTISLFPDLQPNTLFYTIINHSKPTANSCNPDFLQTTPEIHQHTRSNQSCPLVSTNLKQFPLIFHLQKQTGDRNNMGVESN